MRSALAQGDPAQGYPAKPIRIIVGFGPGGGNDIFARLIGQKLSERLGQPVLVENKPGAGAIIATEYVAKAPPDGYTLLVGATGAMTISPAVYSKLPYVTMRDFVPISMIASFPLLVTVNADAPVKSVAGAGGLRQGEPGESQLRQLLARVPARHRAVQAEDGGAARAHRLQEQRRDADRRGVGRGAGGARGRAAGLGPPEGRQDPGAGGHVGAAPLRVSGGADHGRGRRARISTCACGRGSSRLPPRRAGIIKKLEKELMEIIKLPDVRERLKGLAVDPAGSTSQEFSRMIAAELPRWAAIAKTANIKLD